MNTLTIQTMRLKNFKGVSSFTLEPFGQDTTVAGRNEAGKTTIFDGMAWLLFGKDSQGKADFSIKPQDEHGNDIHNLDTEVEITFDLNGKGITLMKRYRENWVTRRGTASPEMSGHKTECEIDGVPTAITKFNSHIAEIIDAEVFKLVTNPFAFNNDLHWTKRRELLLGICGDVSDQDVISSNPDLASLSEILNNCTAEDHKKKVKAQQKKINDELEQIPVRIDELTASIEDVQEPDQDETARVKAKLEAEREKLRQMQSNERLSAKRAELADVNAKISKILAQAGNQEAEAKKGINADLSKLQARRREIDNQIQDLKSDISRDQQRNRVTNDALANLRKKWAEIQAENSEVKTDCPTCGQDLPESQIQDAQDRLNKNKAKRLEANQTEGKALKETFDSRKKLIADSEAKVADLSQALAEVDQQIKAKEQALKEAYVPAVDPATDELDQKKGALESEIKAIENGSKVREKDCKERIVDLEKDLSVLKEAEAAWAAAEKSRARIHDLGAKEKKLAAKYEALVHELHLVEQFVISKVNLVEGNINYKFELARFKLFREQINGGVEECCETMCRGVQYNHGLNNAARINTGLDIIRTISEHFKFRAPVFIDNSESVNELLPIDSQVVCLAVSKDPELLVEIHGDDEHAPVEAA